MELNFRVWNHKDKKMSSTYNLKDFLISSNELLKEWENITFMRGTGFLDINKNEIFEGDIITCNNKKSHMFSNDPQRYYYEIKWDKNVWNSFPIVNLEIKEFDPVQNELNDFWFMWPNLEILRNSREFEIVENVYETKKIQSKNIDRSKF